MPAVLKLLIIVQIHKKYEKGILITIIFDTSFVIKLILIILWHVTGAKYQFPLFFFYVSSLVQVLMYRDSKSAFLQVTLDQGNLKGESVVVAILPSRMEVSYCSSAFFVAIPCQAISLSVSCLSGRVDLNQAPIYRLSCGESCSNDNVRICTE